MKDNKKEGIISKFNFNFGIGSKSEGAVAVLEKDTFESSAIVEQGIQEQVEFSKFSTEKNMKHIANIINGLATIDIADMKPILNLATLVGFDKPTFFGTSSPNTNVK